MENSVVIVSGASNLMSRIVEENQGFDSKLRNLKNFWEVNAEKEKEEAVSPFQVN